MAAGCGAQFIKETNNGKSSELRSVESRLAHTWLISIVQGVIFVVTTAVFGEHVAVNIHGNYLASYLAFEKSTLSSCDTCQQGQRRPKEQSYTQLQVEVNSFYEKNPVKTISTDSVVAQRRLLGNEAARVDFDSTVVR